MDFKKQFYGTEIEMTGITRQHAAEVVAQMFGSSIHHRSSYDSWCLYDPQGKERSEEHTSELQSQR